MDDKDCRGKSQCRLKDLTKLMSSLSHNQQNFLEDIEFHKFIGVSYSTDLPKDLTWDLVSRVDVDKGTLVINGTPFNIEESVKRLLPLPHGSDEYEIKNIPNNSEDDDLLNWKAAFTDVGQYRGKGLPETVLLKRLEDLEDRESFLQHFVLLILSYYLAPTTTDRVNRDFLRLIEDVDKIKEWNWSKLVADFLISGIDYFRKQSGQGARYVKGCLHILPLIYFNHKQKPVWEPEYASLLHFVGDRETELNALEVDDEEDKNGESEHTVREKADKNGESEDEETTEGVCKIITKYFDAVYTTRHTKAERYKTELIEGLLDVSFEIIDHIVMKEHSKEQAEGSTTGHQEYSNVGDGTSGHQEGSTHDETSEVDYPEVSTMGDGTSGHQEGSTHDETSVLIANEDNEKDEDMPIPIPNKKRKKQETTGLVLPSAVKRTIKPSRFLVSPYTNASYKNPGRKSARKTSHADSDEPAADS